MKRRLVESEIRAIQGTGDIPSYANNQAYSLDYVRRDDAVIKVKPNVTLVRHQPSDRNGIVYRYIGTTEKNVNLTAVNYVSDPEWQNSGQPASGFVADGALDRFESDNRTVQVSQKVEGGGWLDSKLVRTTVTIDRVSKTFLHTRSKRITQSPLNSPEVLLPPNVTISSRGTIRLKGNIETAATGSVTLNSSHGAILGDKGVAIYSNTPTLAAGGDIDVQIEGDRGPLSAIAGGDLFVTAISKDNISSRLTVRNVTANGRIQLTAANGITAASSTALIWGNRIDLIAPNGAIGTPTEPVLINSSAPNGAINGGLTALARDSISITEVSGDLNLLAPLTTSTAAASVESTAGNVILTASAGSIRDRWLEEPIVAAPTFSTLTLRERAWANAGLAANLFSPQSLNFTMSPSMATFLYPHGQTASPPANGTSESPNVKGGFVTLSAQSTNAEIGSMGDQTVISNPQRFGLLTTPQASLLTSAKPDDVIGVQYSLYRYIGAAQTNVVLQNENFNDVARWQPILADLTTGADANAPIIRTLSTGQRLRVEFNASDYGLYQYLGPPVPSTWRSKTIAMHRGGSS